VPGRNRRLGYRRALEACGLAADPELEVTTEFTIEDGARSLHRLLDRGGGGSGGPVLDAVFCANDQLALGASQALHSRGLRIPEDVAVAGMDDTVLVRAGWPPLTSVDLGSAERGRIAARMLLERISGAGQAGSGQDRSGPADPGPAGSRQAGSGRERTRECRQRLEPPPRVRTVTPRLVVRASTDPAASEPSASHPRASGPSASGTSASGVPSPGGLLDGPDGEVAP
jgi:ABC-type sugar transport system substrate-binding protein